jgi:hypothetical protein
MVIRIALASLTGWRVEVMGSDDVVLNQFNFSYVHVRDLSDSISDNFQAR